VKDKDLYQRILGIEKPWEVVDVDLQLARGEVHVHVALPSKTRWVCPDCHERAPVHDHREGTWRHLDTCQYRTVLHARVPRLSCPTHGIRQLQVPWAEPGSRFTALFEALAIDWLFHLAQNLGKAVDQVRRAENRKLRSEGKPWLTGTRYDWLRNPKSFSLKHWRRFLRSMRKRQLKTARAWLLKEEFMALLDYKRVKTNARSFRNRDRFRMAIMFHCGGLDLYPQLTTRS
jgi:transposase